MTRMTSRDASARLQSRRQRGVEWEDHVREDGSMIPVLLVDHDVLARRGMSELISAQPDMRVVGETSDCDEALELARTGQAQVIISEARITGRHCAELLGGLHRDGRPLGLIVLTDSERGEDVLRVVQAGAAAYLRKSSPSSEIVNAVRVVAGGGHLLAPCALDTVLRDYSSRCRKQAKEKQRALTVREREVLTLIAQGRSTREIGTELRLSHRTVEVHRSHIMHKLQRHKVAHLVRYALREGLVSPY
jgi:DNA-binding NarL/FixJ family response regulator